MASFTASRSIVRTGAIEPAVAAGGVAVVGASMVLPSLWRQGINPVPPCLFHLATGRPCPFCGLTRSFVATARFDLAAAVHVYPLGPLLFALLLAATVGAAWWTLARRRPRLHLAPGATKLVAGVAVGLLALNWAAKLLFLGY